MPRFYFDLRAHRESAPQGRDAVDAGRRHLLRARRRPRRARGGGLGGRLRAPRACGAAARAGLAALGFALLADPAHASDTVTAAWLPDGRRVGGAQRRAQGARPRPGRRPGQAERQDPAHRPPRRGDRRGRRWPRSPSSRPRASTSGCPSHGEARRWRWRCACGRRRDRRPSRHEDPRRRAARRRGPGAPARGARRRRPDRPRRARSSWRALPDYDALLVRSQVQVDAEAIAAGRRLVVIGRAGVGVDNIDLAAATRGRRHRRQRADRQHDRRRRAHARAAVRARPAHRRRPTPRCAAASGSAASSRASSCAAGRWASSAWARSAWPSPTARGRWRWRSSATTRS